MSREIKFRAWQDNQMLHQENSGVYGAKYLLDKCYEDCALMQFTGLLDKNGREIYEGDVLFWDGSIVGAVNFKHAEFIVGSGVNARALCAAPEDEIEIIGNIHENPELIANGAAVVEVSQP